MPLTKCSECVFLCRLGGGQGGDVCKRHAPLGIQPPEHIPIRDYFMPKWPQLDSYHLHESDDQGCGDGERSATDAN